MNLELLGRPFEEKAIEFLKKQNYYNIYYTAKYKFRNFYDMEATKNNIRYLIEVKGHGSNNYNFIIRIQKIKKLLHYKHVLFIFIIKNISIITTIDNVLKFSKLSGDKLYYNAGFAEYQNNGSLLKIGRNLVMVFSDNEIIKNKLSVGDVIKFTPIIKKVKDGKNK